jgi:alpha/beta hydrolase fold
MSNRCRAVAAVVLMAAVGAPTRARGQDSPQRHTRAINDIQMSYRALGQGTPLLLLHYFGGCGQIWQPHIERLAQEFRLIIPDLRGHGGSTNPSGEFTHGQAARSTRSARDPAPKGHGHEQRRHDPAPHGDSAAGTHRRDGLDRSDLLLPRASQGDHAEDLAY